MFYGVSLLFQKLKWPSLNTPFCSHMNENILENTSQISELNLCHKLTVNGDWSLYY